MDRQDENERRVDKEGLRVEVRCCQGRGQSASTGSVNGGVAVVTVEEGES